MRRFVLPAGSALAGPSLDSPADVQLVASTRLAFLDGLRALAALAVFGYHASLVASPEWAIFFSTRFDPGQFGVVLFFLCSGFIIPVSLERHRSLKRFWIGRVCRLYPLYWCSVLLVAACLALAAPGSPADQRWTQLGVGQITPGGLVLNLTMLQSFVGVPDLLAVYWTLAFELLFYGIVSLLFMAGWLRRSVLLAAGFSLLAVLIEVALPLLTGQRYASGPLTYLALMFSGTVLYQYVHGRLARRDACIVVGLALLVVLVTTLGSPTRLHWASTPGAFLLARLAAIGVFCAALRLRARSVPGWLVYLGQISYSLYLLHTFVIVVIPPSPSLGLTLLIWLLSLIGLAALTYRWIELPGMALSKRLTTRRGASR